jgi:hypothetical protein
VTSVTIHPPSRKHVGLSADAVDEPLPPVVIVAASAAIVVHDEEAPAPFLGKYLSGRR